MPVSWELADQVLVVTVNHDWVGGTPAQAITRAVADPRFRPGSALLLDVRESDVNPTGAQIQHLAGFIAGLRGLGPKVAVVVSPRPYQYGVSRMLEAYLEGSGVRVRIFRQLEEALEWLA